eukprot:scaffold3581_cov73-Skeletonema_marinoi.AAC.6
MTSTSSNNNVGQEINLADSLDDFLSNMDREREAINARILAAYGEGGEGRGQRQHTRIDKFAGSHHDTSVNNVGADNGAQENYDHDHIREDRSTTSSAASLLISVRGDDNDGSKEVLNGLSAELGGAPSHSTRNYNRTNNTQFKRIDGTNNSSSENTADDVYNITQQSQQLYDKLNISYNSHQKEDTEETTSTATATAGLPTNPTMTTYNSSPSGSSYLGTPPPLVVKKVVDEWGAGQQQQKKSSTIQEDSIVPDVPTAGSNESYDWVLQQLSKKTDASAVGHYRETDDMSLKNSTAAAASTTTTTSAVKQDAAKSLTQPEPTTNGWFRNNTNRVSVLLRVNNHHTTTTKAAAASSPGGDDNILFPMPFGNNDQHDSTSTSNIPQTESRHRGKIVLINPNTFHNEKRLRGGGNTVDIARLVAQVSQISSTEDWARQYQFDDVSGMGNMDGNGNGNALDDDAVDSLSSLAQQLTGEVSGGNRKCSTVLFAAGGTKSGKTRMVFGPFISSMIASVTTMRSENPPSNLGVVGEIIQQVLKSNNQCSVSILEIADDDVLRDILGFSEGRLNEQRGTSALRLRHSHSDRKRGGGPATVENLWQVPMTSFEEACEIISDAFQSRSLRKIWREEGGHGHFVVTIRCNGGSGDDESCFQVVDLASPDCQATTTSPSRINSIRKSLSALRGILRELATNHPNTSTTSALPVSFRECTLTKVIQRNVEGHDTNGLSRAVVIGCVNPSSRDYSQTLRTMDFMTSISAKTGEITRSPFRDGSARSAPASSPVASTPKQPDSDEALLKSIVSDPRQRLAKFLTPQSNTKDGRGSQEKSRKIATPRSGSTHSDAMAQQRFRDTYTSVFDQLENLMSNEEEEDNIDRDSYGNTIIQAITPNPKSHSKKKLPDPSPDTEAEVFFSPLYNLTPPVGRSPHGVKKGSTDETEMDGSLQQHNQRGDESGKQRFQSRKEVTKDGVKADTGPHLFSEIEFERSSPSDGENWNEFSPVSLSNGRANQDIFVEKSKLIPLKTLISHDSMESELLVSCRSNANVKVGLTSSGLDSVDRPKLPSSNYQTTEAAVAEQDVSSIVKSFQQEVEALVKNSPSSKFRSKDGSGRVTGRSGDRLDSVPTKDTNEDYNSSTNSNVIRGEVVALKSMLEKFKKEKETTDAFVQKLQMVIDETESDDFDDDTSFPSNCFALLNSVREQQVMVADLQRELEECKAQNTEITRELNRSVTDKSFEKDLVRAKQLLSDQAKKSLALETEVKLEKARVKELSSEKTAFSTLLREIDEKLDMGTPSKQNVCDASRQKLRLERMERTQAGLQQLFAKNQELERLLKESCDEGNKARKLVELLEAKVVDLQRQANQSKGPSSRAVEAAEKLAEEAVRDNEALSNENAQMRDSITRIRNEYQSLSQQHRGVVAMNTELSAERERLLARNHSETMSIRKAFDACKEEKAQLEEQLATFSSKTAEMMKQRIDHMKEVYVRRLSMQQATIKQLEEQKDMRQLAAMSSVKNENENLRMRI